MFKAINIFLVIKNILACLKFLIPNTISILARVVVLQPIVWRSLRLQLPPHMNILGNLEIWSKMESGIATQDKWWLVKGIRTLLTKIALPATKRSQWLQDLVQAWALLAKG